MYTHCSYVFVFATTCVRSKNLVCLLILQFNGLFLSAPNIYTDLNSIWVECAGVWAKVTQMKWTVFMKYVTLEEFTPVLQIVYTFFVFGLNVQMSRVKLPPMKWTVFIMLSCLINTEKPRDQHIPRNLKNRKQLQKRGELSKSACNFSGNSPVLTAPICCFLQSK